MNETTTITAATCGMRVGDEISLYVADRRWWARLLSWITKRPRMVRQSLRITHVSGSQFSARKENERP
jgi:hypothetical protein